MKPLVRLDELAKKFNITGEKRLPTDVQLSFAHEQVTQMRQIANRLLYDLTTSHTHHEAAKDDTTKAAYQQKIGEYERDLRQTAASLDTALALEKNLTDKLAKETE